MRSILILFMITVTFAAKAGEIPNAIAEDNKDIGALLIMNKGSRFICNMFPKRPKPQTR